MATIGDGLVAIGIALIILAFVSPLIVMELKEEPNSDYESCINNCPKNLVGYYKNLECPEMCLKNKECSQNNKVVGNKVEGE